MLSLIFPTLLGRLSYFVRLVLLNGISWFAIMELSTTSEVKWADWGFLALLTLYGVVFVFLPRVRDCGMSGWSLLFSIVPGVSSLYGMILLFAPSRPLAALKSSPAERTVARPTVPGGECAVCGKRLIVASDGAIVENRILCNDCRG